MKLRGKCNGFKNGVLPRNPPTYEPCLKRTIESLLGKNGRFLANKDYRIANIQFVIFEIWRLLARDIMKYHLGGHTTRTWRPFNVLIPIIVLLVVHVFIYNLG